MNFEEDGLGDRRLAAAARIAQDVPAAFPGGPSHKAGTPLYQAAHVVTEDGRNIGFHLPSSTALALSLSIKARKAASGLLSTIEFDDVFTPDGRGKAVRGAHTPALFDFFEHCMVCTSFAFQALEVFSNHSISRHLKEATMVEIRGKKQTLTPPEIERRMSTEEKLCQVLPKLLGVSSPKGKSPWPGFLRLKAARDATIHLKYADQQVVDSESIYFQFLSNRFLGYPDAAIDLLRWFSQGKEPRWLQLAPVHEGA